MGGPGVGGLAVGVGVQAWVTREVGVATVSRSPGSLVTTTTQVGEVGA